MKLNLNTGFLLFLRKFTRQDWKASEIFGTIHEYFFSYKKMVRQTYEAKLALDSELAPPSSCDMATGIFYTSKERQAILRGLLSETETNYIHKEVLKKEKIINSVRLFRQMLIEHKIDIFLINRKDESAKQVSSSNLFTTREDYDEILYNNFESYHSHDLKYHEDSLSQTMGIFFGEFKNQNKYQEIFRKDEYIDAFYRLFPEEEVIKLIHDFPDDKDWTNTDTHDCRIVAEIHKRYSLPITPARTLFLPMLKFVRKQFTV